MRSHQPPEIHIIVDATIHEVHIVGDHDTVIAVPMSAPAYVITPIPPILPMSNSSRQIYKSMVV